MTNKAFNDLLAEPRAKYPIHPERMARRMERMANLGILAKIPAALVMESKITLSAYYGGSIRSGVVLIREGLYLGAVGWYWSFVFWLCDRAGWTKILPFEDTWHSMRHGCNCDGNCEADCIHEAIPVWYRKLTMMDRV